MELGKKLMIITVIFFTILAVYITVTESAKYKPPLDDCSHLTNETYNNYSNSYVCKFNGTGWESFFGNNGVHLRGT